MDKNKKRRIPIITRDTYKNCAAWFPIVMLVVAIFAAIQTWCNCRACYLAYGTTLAVTETFVYCGTIWGIVSMVMTFAWWLLIGTMFIIGRFVGNPISVDPVRSKETPISNNEIDVVIEDKAENTIEDNRAEIAMLNKQIEQQSRGG